MKSVLFKNARIFDGVNGDCASGMQVLVEDGIIVEVSERHLQPVLGSMTINVAGRTLMPGLIDAHVHSYFCDVDWQKTDMAGEAYRAAYAVRVLGFALDCGFTTVRDIGGGDYTLWRAIEDGWIRAPRFLYAGRMISMTGGHGDTRSMHQSHHNQGYCSCGESNALSVIADGVDSCVKAAREELRRGAHCLKIMASGGVTSPTDPIWMNQFREEEIRAIVSEAAGRRTYVSAHCHSISAIRRCLDCGVRVIEHGTLIDDETATVVAQMGGYVVPTTAVIFTLAEFGESFALPPASRKKLGEISDQIMHGLDSMRRANVKVGFGTDLFGQTYVYRDREFHIRSEVFSNLEVLRQATSINAEILQQQNRLGCIKPGALADILVVDGDPLSDISLLASSGKHLRVIMRAGEIVRSDLR